MLDHLGSLDAPDLAYRIDEVYLSSRIAPFHHLRSCREIVGLAVSQTDPGSFSGWCLFFSKEAREKARLRLGLFQASLEPRFRSLVHALLVVVRAQKALKRRVWGPGGTLYTKLARTTGVGKLTTRRDRAQQAGSGS